MPVKSTILVSFAGFSCLAGKWQDFLFLWRKAMNLKAQIMDEATLKRALMRISHEIVEKK
mgnify:CR=1 FL=1